MVDLEFMWTVTSRPMPSDCLFYYADSNRMPTESAKFQTLEEDDLSDARHDLDVVLAIISSSHLAKLLEVDSV